MSTKEAQHTLTREAPGANPRAPYYPALDGLRAVAVILVFFAHYAGFAAGAMGVDIFFVLSGFLITGLLFDAQEQVHRYRNFYARRTLRIFPLYYAVWIGLILFTPIIHISWKPINVLWPTYLGNYITLLHFLHGHSRGPALVHIIYGVRTNPSTNNQPHLLYTGHFWSLCVEEQFYLVWPWIVFTIRQRRHLIWFCLAVVVGSPVVRFILTDVLPVPWFGVLHLFTPLRLDEFLLGGAAALLLRGPSAKLLRRLAPWLLLGSLLLLLSVTVLHAMLYPNLEPCFESERWLLRYGFTLTGLFALGLILTCLDNRFWLTRVLNWSPLRAIGRISYGFYVFHDLFHEPYNHLIRFLHLRMPYGIMLPFMGTLAISTLSYLVLERPILRHKVRFDS